MKNGKMSMVYDGQIADDLTKDELIKAILREYEVQFEENTVRAMEEAFRCGFLCGEEYGKKANCRVMVRKAEGAEYEVPLEP